MTPIATHMYQGLAFKIYRNIKCDTGPGDALHSNYSTSAISGRSDREIGTKRREKGKVVRAVCSCWVSSGCGCVLTARLLG